MVQMLRLFSQRELAGLEWPETVVGSVSVSEASDRSGVPNGDEAADRPRLAAGMMVANSPMGSVAPPYVEYSRVMGAEMVALRFRSEALLAARKSGLLLRRWSFFVKERLSDIALYGNNWLC